MYVIVKHRLPVQYRTEGSVTPKIFKKTDRQDDFLKNVANYLDSEIIITEKTHTTFTLQLKRKIILHYFILQLKKEAFVGNAFQPWDSFK